MGRIGAGLVLVLMLGGCTGQDVTCGRIEGRLAALKEFCGGLAMQAAQDQCGSEAQCAQLVMGAAFEGCVPRAGGDRLAWAWQEFCAK